MTFRSDLDALRARHDALETEVAARQQELLETRRMIDEVQRRASLPVLDSIRVASPCSADWGRMTGDERVRACGDCDKNVYNLSGMTREEAEALILEKEGRLCVRYYRRADGTILFGDCTVGAQHRRGRRVLAGVAVLLTTAGVAAYGAFDGAHVLGKMEPLPEVEMGKMRGELPPELRMGLAVVEPEVPEPEVPEPAPRLEGELRPEKRAPAPTSGE
ncbi:MAG TPA: hypothetical protein VK932_04210 [Kofleriaceae bacterium]|nr:hypothetical protein [Kofleriaceae bacterium]